MSTPQKYNIAFTEAEWYAIQRALIRQDAPWHDAAAERIQSVLTDAKRAESEEW